MTTQIRTRTAAAVCSAALLSGLALAGAPAANAQEVPNAPAKDVMMPFPLGGEHNVRFGAFNACSWPEGKGNGPVRQAFNANAVDLDVPMASNPFDPMQFLPFNSATVQWTNKATGATGSETVTTGGKEVGVRDLDTGVGDIEVSITVTRSLLPTMNPGSAVPGVSATHTETFLVAGIDPAACEAR